MAADETKPDETKSDSRGRAVDPALEQEVMGALLDPDKRTVDEVEELLTRCAAEHCACGPTGSARRAQSVRSRPNGYASSS